MYDKDYFNQEMNDTIELLTRMILSGATDDEIMAVVKYSRAVVDAKNSIKKYELFKKNCEISGLFGKYIKKGSES